MGKSRGKKGEAAGGRDGDVGTHTGSAQRELVMELQGQSHEAVVGPHADKGRRYEPGFLFRIPGDPGFSDFLSGPSQGKYRR